MVTDKGQLAGVQATDQRRELPAFRLTILLMAMAVGGYVVDDGSPFFGYAIIGAAFWEGFLAEWWERGGHWARVLWYRGWALLFLATFVFLAFTAS